MRGTRVSTMAEARMIKSRRKSMDVFEFREEDDLPILKMSSTKAGSNFGDHASGIGVGAKEIKTQICMSTDVTDNKSNHDTIGSLTPIEAEKISKSSGLSHILHNRSRRHEQATDVKSNIIVSVTGSDLSGMEQDLSAHLTCGAEDRMSEESLSTIATSFDGPSSHDCFSNWDLDDETVGVVFYTDYLEFCGTYYHDSVVRFSRRFIEARGKTIYGKERNFQILLEVEDIVKIDSQWSVRYNTGTVNIYFISKDAAEDNNFTGNASGIQRLNFPAVDSDWYRKQEAIESLDVRYKAVWSVLLDTGIENCSDFPEGEAAMLTRRYFPNFPESFQGVIYPKDDPDPVSITKRDVDLLLPETFVNDTIIDFYIKYLKIQMNVEEQNKYHFSNSFFFRKLVGMDKDPTSAFDGKAAFARVRKWTKKINLLEKDFIFIPVNYSYHWSLIVVCYFSDVVSYEDSEEQKSVRVPCILHMDSLRGNHHGLKDLMQSYLWEEWKERTKGTCEDLYSKFKNLKFIPLELPQQQNSFDCGLFLLHYVELFLKDVPANFSIYKITSSSKFLQSDWFPPGEASMKRVRIEILINNLLSSHSEDRPKFEEASMEPSPQYLNTTQVYHNEVEFSIKCSQLQDWHESSGIISLSSKTNAQRTTPRFNSNKFVQVSTSEALVDAPQGAMRNKASSHEFTAEGLESIDPYVEDFTHPLPSLCKDCTLDPTGISHQSGGSCFVVNLEDMDPKAKQSKTNHSSAFISSNKSDPNTKRMRIKPRDGPARAII